MPRSGWAIVLLTLGGWACGSTPGNPTGSSTTSSSTPTTIPQTTITTTSSTGGGTGFTVSGTVTDGTSGGVLPNIVIRITDGVNADKTATTGTAGTYAIPVVTPGTMTLSAAATGYVTQAKGVVVSADTRVDWVMARVPSTTTTVTTTSSSTTTSIATTSASYAGGNILDLSLFFTVPPGGLVAFLKPSRVHAEATYNVTGTFTAGGNQKGRITGTLLNGTPANGSFDGTVFLDLTGCTASRRYSGTVTTGAVHWGNQGDVVFCSGATWPFGAMDANAK